MVGEFPNLLDHRRRYIALVGALQALTTGKGALHSLQSYHVAPTYERWATLLILSRYSGTAVASNYRSNNRFVASHTASPLAVSGLSRTSALPVISALSRPLRVVTPTNTNSCSNASISLQPSNANTRSPPPP